MWGNTMRRLTATGRRSSRGFTTTEATILITAMAVMAGAATPTAMNYVNTAKRIKAEGDVEVIGAAFTTMMADMGSSRLKFPGGVQPKLLVSRGRVPEVGPRGESTWQGPLDGQSVVSMEDVLYSNSVGLPLGEDERGGLAFGWNGPYLQLPIQADSWGNRYAINTAHLGSDGFSTFVLSAGPDGAVNTPFSVTVPPADADDLVFIIEGP